MFVSRYQIGSTLDMLTTKQQQEDSWQVYWGDTENCAIYRYYGWFCVYAASTPRRPWNKHFLRCARSAECIRAGRALSTNTAELTKSNYVKSTNSNKKKMCQELTCCLQASQNNQRYILSDSVHRLLSHDTCSVSCALQTFDLGAHLCLLLAIHTAKV